MPIHKKYGLSREERISNKKELSLLFSKGASFFIYPFHVFVVATSPQEQKVKILLSASKKKIKTASQRNRLKRLMREAYRKNKHTLINNFSEKPESTLLIAIIHSGGKTFNAQKTEQKIQLIIQRLLSLHDKIPFISINQSKRK
ncbi:MAG: ribonuclease P protein component [Bacteroidales bacterium]|nr:ribonuclease P protein component [Bacteroidales bacterium]MCF8327224.1 ribonuclease P protein component [Bacteroidales bacterium]